MNGTWWRWPPGAPSPLAAAGTSAAAGSSLKLTDC
jgi:hypothetical protein